MLHIYIPHKRAAVSSVAHSVCLCGCAWVCDDSTLGHWNSAVPPEKGSHRAHETSNVPHPIFTVHTYWPAIFLHSTRTTGQATTTTLGCMCSEVHLIGQKSQPVAFKSASYKPEGIFLQCFQSYSSDVGLEAEWENLTFTYFSHDMEKLCRNPL